MVTKIKLKSVKACVVILFIIAAISCCATQQTQNSHPLSSYSTESITAKAADSPASLLSVRAEDYSDRTVVRIVTDKELLDYLFQQSRANEFTLFLKNVHIKIGSKIVKNTSSRIKTLKIEQVEEDRVAVTGYLKSSLRSHDARSEGKTLLLTLYFRGLGEITRSSILSSMKKALPNEKAKRAKKPLRDTLPGNRAWTEGLSYYPKYTGKPISLDLQDADVVNVLRLLADIGGKNIVIEPDVTGKVTLKVERVPWDQILDMVLQINQLGKVQAGNVIRIAKIDKLKKELKEQQERLKAQMEIYKARQQLQVASMDRGEITTAYLQVNYSKIGSIAKKIRDFKSPVGRVTVDERTNLIIYSDYPARIQAAKELLSRLDQPNKQILIEARIVELTEQATRALGITWNAESHSQDDIYFDQYFAINHPISATSFLGLNVGKITGNPIWNIDMLLQAAESAGQGRVISAPRVLTLDNVEATISQGTEIPYYTPTGLVTSDRQGNLVTVVTTSFKKATLELRVTPHVTPDRRILLEIKAKKERPNFAAVQPGQAPPVDTRSIETQLLVDDNDTVVIGGILEENEESTESKTPGLYQIPILGRLFKSEQRNSRRTELLIFISPRIIGAES